MTKHNAQRAARRQRTLCRFLIKKAGLIGRRCYLQLETLKLIHVSIWVPELHDSMKYIYLADNLTFNCPQSDWKYQQRKLLKLYDQYSNQLILWFLMIHTNCKLWFITLCSSAKILHLIFVIIISNGGFFEICEKKIIYIFGQSENMNDKRRRNF